MTISSSPTAAGPPEIVVDVRGLRVRRGNTEIVRGVDIAIRRGEVFAIVGPSGGGKTTLLRAFNYLTPFSAGEVEIAGHTLRPGLSERTHAALLRSVRTKVGMVFQHFHLFPHLTARENVEEAPRRVLGLEPTAVRKRADDLLDKVGLSSHAAAYPQTLSGGQQQRVALARALAMEPQVLLLDEPTSSLDPALKSEVLAVIADVAATGQTMIIVTHEVSFARRIAHRVAVLANGEIVDSGTPAEVLDAPRSEATRTILRAE